MSGLGGRPWSEWIARYGRSHEHPLNRVCHTIGIPLIALSIPLGVAAVGGRGFGASVVLVTVGGWEWFGAGLLRAGGERSREVRSQAIHMR